MILSTSDTMKRPEFSRLSSLDDLLKETRTRLYILRKTRYFRKAFGFVARNLARYLIRKAQINEPTIIHVVEEIAFRLVHDDHRSPNQSG